MAASNYETQQYSSEQFVESCGTILFHESTRQICLVCSKERNIWLLAKGRRNIGESRHAAALRETTEETGFVCKALPVNMHSRATPWDEDPQTTANVTPDIPRLYEGIVGEPFLITHRILPGNNGIKLIYWYIAVVDESAARGEHEELFGEVRLFDFEEALTTLNFATDRDIVRKAIEIFDATKGE